ncbi:hypothetical protein ACFWAY_38405 [Rhodococcus sp. NPDC059968]
MMPDASRHSFIDRLLITDKLASYQIAHRELMPSVVWYESTGSTVAA